MPVNVSRNIKFGRAPSFTSRAFFYTADWLWGAIPASPTLHANSATWAGYMGAGGTSHGAALYDFGVALVPPNLITGGTPRYTVPFANEPEWGAHPFGANTVPIPVGTVVPSIATPLADSHLAVVDPTNGLVFGMWQAAVNNGPPITWSASWGGVATIGGDGIDYAGSSTATAISRYAGVLTGAEMTAAVAANTGVGHTLFCSIDCASPAFVAPAIKSDGDNVAGVATPIPEGIRLQLNPSINVDAISGILPGEKVIAKTLQTHGIIVGDKGGARMAVLCEYKGAVAAGNPFYDAGLEWDYFELSHIPWGSLRALAYWHGGSSP